VDFLSVCITPAYFTSENSSLSSMYVPHGSVMNMIDFSGGSWAGAAAYARITFTPSSVIFFARASSPFTSNPTLSIARPEESRQLVSLFPDPFYVFVFCHGWAQTKFSATFVSPVPLYIATCG